MRAISRCLSNPLLHHFQNIPAHRRKRKMLKLLQVCHAYRAGFVSIPQSNLATGEDASHLALVFALACGQSREYRVCRRVHIRARVGVFLALYE